MSPAKSTSEKIAIFQNLFSGRRDVYGTYLQNGKAFMVNRPVNETVLFNHLIGKKAYGFYMLIQSITTVLVIDFDHADSFLPSQFILQAKHYQLPAYLEKSKSKGWHVWIFFGESGVNAAKARTVGYNILKEIEAPANTEIFPKQDRIENHEFGNFINAPLFGKKVVDEGRTVFVDPISLDPHKDQWAFLETIKISTEKLLDEIIEINEWRPLLPTKLSQDIENLNKRYPNKFQILLPCTQKMLLGVTQFQRLSAFRLAIHLKNYGFPYEITKELLKAWSQLNRPINGKSIIKESEIISQVNSGYKEKYTSFGCGEPETVDFCSDQCPLFSKNMGFKLKA
jgi:hypothetical protein